MSIQQPNLMDSLFAPERAEVYREFYWHGAFPDYLKILEENPRVARTAFQRMYDMILSYGVRQLHREPRRDRPLQLLRRSDR